MWLYTGTKDSTRINAADLSEKELQDEVRRLTHFSQEDTIPLEALQDPYDLRHLPAEVILLSWPSILDMMLYSMIGFNFELPLSCQGTDVARCYPLAPETGVEPEDDESEENAEENIEVVDDSDATEDEEEEETEDVRAFTIKRRKIATDELTDTAESSPSG